MRWLLDGMNVIGSRPDGWWRDRPAARRSLVSALADLAHREGLGPGDIAVVFDGQDAGGEVVQGRTSGVDVRFAGSARDAADAEIVRILAEEVVDPALVTVVTSDGALGASVRRAGARLVGASALYKMLDGGRSDAGRVVDSGSDVASVVRFALELAAPPARPPAAGPAFRALAEAAGEAGWDTLVVAPGPDPASGDPFVLAASLAAGPAPARLGVVAPLPGGRHPSVVAREATPLDVVTGGRALVVLRLVSGAEPLPIDAPGAYTSPHQRREDPDGPVEYLAESGAICRALFCDDHPVFEGRYLHVAGALNRPGPRQPSGPPVVAEPPGGWAASVGRDPSRAALARRLVASVAGLLCRGGPAEVASWRALADTAGTESVRVLWRIEPGADPDGILGAATSACSAGADGVVVAAGPDGARAAELVAARDALEEVWGR